MNWCLLVKPERSSTERDSGHVWFKDRRSVEFDRHWQECYRIMSAITWSPDGKTLAASSAAGEVFLYQAEAFQETPLQASNGTRLVPRLLHDGQFLAAGGPKRTGLAGAGRPA